MKKRIITLLALLAIVFAIASCGSSDETNEGSFESGSQEKNLTTKDNQQNGIKYKNDSELEITGLTLSLPLDSQTPIRYSYPCNGNSQGCIRFVEYNNQVYYYKIDNGTSYITRQNTDGSGCTTIYTFNNSDSLGLRAYKDGVYFQDNSKIYRYSDSGIEEVYDGTFWDFQFYGDLIYALKAVDGNLYILIGKPDFSYFDTIYQIYDSSEKNKVVHYLLPVYNQYIYYVVDKTTDSMASGSDLYRYSFSTGTSENLCVLSTQRYDEALSATGNYVYAVRSGDIMYYTFADINFLESGKHVYSNLKINGNHLTYAYSKDKSSKAGAIHHTDAAMGTHVVDMDVSYEMSSRNFYAGTKGIYIYSDGWLDFYEYPATEVDGGSAPVTSTGGASGPVTDQNLLVGTWTMVGNPNTTVTFETIGTDPNNPNFGIIKFTNFDIFGLDYQDGRNSSGEISRYVFSTDTGVPGEITLMEMDAMWCQAVYDSSSGVLTLTRLQYDFNSAGYYAETAVSISLTR